MQFDRRSVVSAIALGAVAFLTTLPGGSQELTKLNIATTPIDIGAQPVSYTHLTLPTSDLV